MAVTIVQINFRFTGPRAEYEQHLPAVAEQIAGVPGLRWKVWLMNEAESTAGGIYLFEDPRAAEAYVHGPIVAHLRSAPFVHELTIRQSGIIEGLTATTRGPVS